MSESYTNQCYRKAPCLHGTPVTVSRADHWDYYDKTTRSFINLDCRLHQKHYTPSLLQIEEADKHQSGLSTETYETPDLQLADSNGIWFTRSEDPELYNWSPDSDEPKTCNLCDIVCDIRDMQEYLHDDGTCPFDDPAPSIIYHRIDDHDQPCRDYLHPLFLQDIKSINRRRARTAKAHIWKHLQEPRWRHALINSGQRMADVWRRNYKPVHVYFDSFQTIALYLKNLPPHMRQNRNLLQRIKENMEGSPSFKENLQKGDWEERLLKNIYRVVDR